MAKTAKTKATASGPDAIVRTALERYRRAEERERENIEQAYEDLKFRAGEQWPVEVEKRRIAEQRPCVTLNHMPKFIRQVTGDIRLNRPAIRVLPADDRGDADTAKAFQGVIRYIETRSDAQSAYYVGLDSQVTAGIGHWQVATRYMSDDTFDQDIVILPIEDGVAVMWDPASVLPTREDAAWCIVPEDMPLEDFKATYPDATASGFDELGYDIPRGWWTEDSVRVAHYWVRKPTTKEYVRTLDGGYAEYNAEDPAMFGLPVVKREVTEVCRYLVTAAEVLEGPIVWPGRFIPIVPVIGEEIRIGKRIVRHGLIRHAKEMQRVLNYAMSTQLEVTALQPKAPWIGTHDNFADFADEWEVANTATLPYLRYKPDPQNGSAPPQRVQPPVSSQGVAETMALAVQGMKEATGLFDASLGARSNEQSGKAILARQREGDVSTYVYIDNFARSVRHTGKILVDLIPKIYDTPRTLRIIGEDGREDEIRINQAGTVDEMTGSYVYKNDLTVGAYDVVLETGPSFTTRREEAREGMTAFLQSAPPAAPLILDLIAKAQDWPNADKIAERLRTLLPPEIRQKEEAEEGVQGMANGAMAPGMPPQTEGPPPEQALAMQMQMQAAQMDLAKKEAELIKARADARKAEAQAMQEEFKAQAMMTGASPAAFANA